MKAVVKPKIYQDTRPKYPVTGCSSHHYFHHCGGFTYEYCMRTAQEQAAMKLQANQQSSGYGTKWRSIDLAIIPMENGARDQSTGEQLFFLEDRSETA